MLYVSSDFLNFFDIQIANSIFSIKIQKSMKEINTSKRRLHLGVLPNLRLPQRQRQRSKQNSQFEYNSSNMLMNTLKSLVDQVSCLIADKNNSFPSATTSRMEQRFQKVLLDIPILAPYEYEKNKNNESIYKHCEKNTLLKQDRKFILQKWLGKLCHEVFSITFSLFEKQKLNKKQSRAFCCQNFILNLLQLIKQNNLQKDEIKHINTCLKQELIPYFVVKYPISMQDEVNIQFASKIIQIDSLGNNQNDLVFKSGVQFNYRKDQNYGRQIMKLLNYIIKLPNERVKIGQKETGKSLFKHFFTDMDNFFKKIQEQKFTIEMNNYDIRSQGQFLYNRAVTPCLSNRQIHVKDQNNFMVDPRIQLQKQKQKELYRQNVRSYTKKLIGRKISQNAQIYNDIQIYQGQLQLQDPALIRIISKWCDQLMYNFNTQANIINKEDQFRMKDGSLRILKRKYLIILAQLLKMQKKNIDEYIKNVNQNNYESQLVFGKQKVPRQFQKFMVEQCEVGLFASSIMRNYEAYLVGYVNVIIHALMTATKNFQQIVKAYEYKQDQYGEEIQRWLNKQISFQQLLSKAFSYRLISVPAVYECFVPQLVSFRVGDILRCKCTSKQKQIIALYTQLQRLSRDPNSDIKIMKLRNRLQLGTKDILINFLYKGKMLVQMQLGIVSTSSKFIDFSNKFNHTLYELRRSQFGPIIELCNIWINDDVKSDFYIQKLKQLNIRKPKISLKENHDCEGANLQYPFKCPQCNFFYNDFSYKIKHILCQNKQCQVKYICSICQTQKYDYNKFQSICQWVFPPIEMLGMRQNERYFEYKQRISLEKRPKDYLEGEQQFGVLVNLKGDQIKYKYFIVRKIQKKQVVVVYHDGTDQQLKQSNLPRFSILKQLQTKQHIQTFKKQYLIFASEAITKKLQSIDADSNKKPLTKYLTNQYFKNKMTYANKNLKSVISIIDGNINDDDIESLKFEFMMVTKLCFYGNDITSIETVSRKFKNCQILDLGDNEIVRLQITPKMQNHLFKIKNLYLNYNKISYVSPQFISELKNLQQLQLGNNRLSQLPPNFKDLANLKILNISRNKFRKVPEQITNLPQLQILNMYAQQKYEEKIQILPDSIGKLKKLKKLNINFNDIRRLPDTFGQLQSLEILYALDNNIQAIPESFRKLQKLVTLNLGKNEFQQIPQILGELTNLQKLNLSMASKKYKQNKRLPNSFCKMKKIRMLDISYNQISLLPDNFGDLTQLQTLFIHDNRIEVIPQSIGDLYKLKLLYASNNCIKQLPSSIGNLSNLIKLTLKQNKQLYYLPKQIKGMQKLKILVLSDTSISSIPEQLYDLERLKQLLLQNTPITRIDQIITGKNILPKLQKFQICENQLDRDSLKNYNVLKEKITRKKTIQRTSKVFDNI